MRTPKLIINYSDMNDSDLASFATRTADALRTNTNFPDMIPAFAEFEPLALDYIAKQAITANGRASGQQKEEKDESRKVLLKSLRAVASYINNFTEVSSIQLSSGFYPVADPKTLQGPDPVEWIKFRKGRLPGEMILDWAAANRAKEYEYTLADELDAENQPIWGDIRRSSRSQGVIVTGLENRTEYRARVRARNIKGESAWSTVVIGFTNW
ncbi:fibronectin type III domain-containing protein [Parapedobacter sp. 10938]|uniref:fibronectin type III domain-containing protein n=1 Tax=Parapedobacter flavus TaxID=3110225 RepID=UPI002DB95165|nr:fibronectin type III domain-containing protein [Parapedobacter sp. 10938]MEC3879739.1 fibronectin type III domain-containing protein [Parapedobacter sp. 10938]